MNKFTNSIHFSSFNNFIQEFSFHLLFNLTWFEEINNVMLYMLNSKNFLEIYSKYETSSHLETI